MKRGRQEKLVNLIRTKELGTQDELIEELRACGYNVTQATISRDIKELQLVKVMSRSGKYCYALSGAKDSDLAKRLASLMTTAVTDIDFAGNLVIIKTEVGMAQALCAAIDGAELDGIAGSIAGDDTIFLAAKTPETAVKTAADLKRMTVV